MLSGNPQRGCPRFIEPVAAASLDSADFLDGAMTARS
jgi:hypothetical protein